MVRLIVASLALAAPVSAAERRYTVTDFDRIRVEGPFEVRLATGRPSAATATGDSRAIDRLAVEVQGRTLRIRSKPGAWGGFPGEGDGPVAIEISTHDLRGAIVQGSGSILVDRAKAMRFDASVSGSGKLSVGKIEADGLVLSLLGSGRIEIGGAAKQLRASIQGAGDLDGAQLVVDDATIGADTSGDIALAVRRTAKITATGAGNVRIEGDPSCTVTSRGSGRVSCGD